MANEKILLMAEANKLGIDGYRKMSADELKAAISSAQGRHTAPAKGKGKAAPETNGATVKGKTKTAPAKGKAAKSAATSTGKGKSTAKSAPAKSTAQKTAPAKGKAAQGTQAKRPTTGGTKGKAPTAVGAKKAVKPRASAKQPTGRVAIDNSAIDWRMESNVGQSGKRKEVLDSLRKHKGDKIKVYNQLVGRAKAFYPAKPKAEAERILVWLIGRVAYDYVYKTGQHNPGSRAAYGTSEAAQDVRRREQREAARKAAAKAARKPAGGAKGKTAAKAKGKTRGR